MVNHPYQVWSISNGRPKLQWGEQKYKPHQRELCHTFGRMTDSSGRPKRRAGVRVRPDVSYRGLTRPTPIRRRAAKGPLPFLFTVVGFLL